MSAGTLTSQSRKAVQSQSREAWSALGALFQERMRQDSSQDVEALRQAAKALAVPWSESLTRVELDMTQVSPAASHVLDAATVLELVRPHAGKDIVLRLPDGLDRIPHWLWHVPDLVELSAREYRSPLAVLQGLRRLSTVILDDRAHDRMTVYRSGTQDMCVLADGTELHEVTWQTREDPDDGLEDDSSEEVQVGGGSIPYVDDDSDSDDDHCRMREDLVEAVPVSLVPGKKAIDWRTLDLARRESIGTRQMTLPKGPFLTINMGQGIVVTGNSIVTTTALYSCCFIAGCNLTTGMSGAYHYPAGQLGDEWVCETMTAWLKALRPNRIVLALSPLSGREALDEQAEHDKQALCRWVARQSGLEPVCSRYVVPAMAFLDGSFQVESFSALARTGQQWEDGIDLHDLPSGEYADEQRSDPISLFGTSMDA